MLLQKKSIHCQHAFTVGLLADIIILNIFMLIALLLIIFAQSRPRPPTACFASVSQVASIQVQGQIPISFLRSSSKTHKPVVGCKSKA